MTNETKHTPLPWFIRKFSNYSGFSIESMQEQMFGCITERWEENPSADRNEAMHANAAFIVDACNQHYGLKRRADMADELADAVEVAIEIICDSYGEDPESTYCDSDCQAVNVLRRNLAQYRGQS